MRQKFITVKANSEVLFSVESLNPAYGQDSSVRNSWKYHWVLAPDVNTPETNESTPIGVFVSTNNTSPTVTVKFTRTTVGNTFFRLRCTITDENSSLLNKTQYSLNIRVIN